MHRDTQVWPLYAVADVAAAEHVPLGEISAGERWELRRYTLEALNQLPHAQMLRETAELWLDELEAEVAAANGADNGAKPLTPGRMEWRRILHNNNLRIGEARSQTAA